MDHAAYLDAYESLTSPALADVALAHGREDWPAAASTLTALRAAQDALWDQYRADAAQLVKP